MGMNGFDARRISDDDVLVYTLGLASQSEREPVIKARGSLDRVQLPVCLTVRPAPGSLVKSKN